MQRVYLVSRYGDLALGLFTGIFAYALYERKQNRPDQDKLHNLVRWKWDQRERAKEVRKVEEEGWEEIEGALKEKMEEKVRR
ncbi:hypothetical protein JCM11641_004463 [Rhodosporidiobolus odoratus]